MKPLLTFYHNERGERICVADESDRVVAGPACSADLPEDDNVAASGNAADFLNPPDALPFPPGPIILYQPFQLVPVDRSEHATVCVGECDECGHRLEGSTAIVQLTDMECRVYVHCPECSATHAIYGLRSPADE